MLVKIRSGEQTAAERALDKPTPTGQKRLAAFGRRVDWANMGKQKRRVEVPALDLEQLRRDFGPRPDRPPQPITGTFRVPVGSTQGQYETIRNEAVARFLKEMDGQGYEFFAVNRIQVAPGLYPAHDLLTGYALLDEREFQVKAWFKLRKPHVIEVDIPGNLLKPLVMRA